jgi:glycosyltransferase involved in cell wall biosynthesis
MKILFVITSWDFGGAEMQVLALAKEMQALTNEVLLVSLIPVNIAFLEKSDGIAVKTLNMKRGFPDLGALFRLKRIIKSFQPDVLHAHMIHAVILARLTRLLIKIPRLVSTAHSINEGGKVRELLYRYTDSFSDINTNVSQAGIDLYLQKNIFKKLENSFFIPNGIALPKLTFSANDKQQLQQELAIKNEFVFLSVGRLELAKDYPNLIEAVILLKKQNIDFKVLIAGEGTQRELIAQIIKNNNLEETVTLLGRRNDISNLLQFADSFVMSSAWEGLPIAILEAASYQLPAVVTAVGGCGEVIKNDKNGFVVPSNNPKFLTKAMQKMMDLSLEDRKKQGLASAEIIKQTYELTKVVQQWLKLYQIN